MCIYDHCMGTFLNNDHGKLDDKCRNCVEICYYSVDFMSSWCKYNQWLQRHPLFKNSRIKKIKKTLFRDGASAEYIWKIIATLYCLCLWILQNHLFIGVAITTPWFVSMFIDSEYLTPLLCTSFIVNIFRIRLSGAYISSTRVQVSIGTFLKIASDSFDSKFRTFFSARNSSDMAKNSSHTSLAQTIATR